MTRIATLIAAFTLVACQVDAPSNSNTDSQSLVAVDLLDCTLPANEPTVTLYFNADECPLVDFFCMEGEVLFSDDCGCGCIEEEGTPPEECVDPADDPTVTDYFTADVCPLIDFSCPVGEESFFDDCGCGCQQ